MTNKTYSDDFFRKHGKRGGKKGKQATTPKQRRDWGRIGGKMGGRPKKKISTIKAPSSLAK